MNTAIRDKAYFVSFCIEQYKHQKGLSGLAAMQQLNEYGVLQYLEENYDVLHTQSWQWILEDIDEYIRVRAKEVK
ncbi:MAG: DUF3791 domain-containing protein, partial [Muribaculaceae bacterium]